MPQEQLPKALKIASYLCMLQLLPSTDMSCLSLKMVDRPSIPTALQPLLATYEALFQGPTALPPSKGAFDHKIPLK